MNALARTRNAPRPDRLRRLLGAWIDPETFDFWATRLDRTWTWQTPLARIVGRRRESIDAMTLQLQPNAHWQGHLPGQHLNLSAEVDGRRITRSYSPSAPPRADGRIEITVRQVEGGRLSTHLCRHARIGDLVELGAAYGSMTLGAAAGPLLLLAAGSGITPLMAITRALAAQGLAQPLTLLYWARTHAELCFVDELRALAQSLPGLAVCFLLTGEAPSMADERAGRISPALLAELVPDLARRQVLACGGSGFVGQARAALGGRVASFQAEAFTPAPACANDDGGSVEVRLAASGRTLQLARGVALLDALEAQGLRPPSGCRMGICNTCRCEKISGSSRDLHTGALASAPAAALKLCVSSAASDLVLDL